MKTIPVWFVALSVFSCFAGATGSHCGNDEALVFNCAVGKKTVSVCGLKPLSGAGQHLQYRFGKLGAPELVFPAQPLGPDETIQANTLTYSGGGGAYIRFKRADYGYVVYTAIGKGWGEKAGVAVEKDGKLQANLSCKKPVQSELGPDLFDQVGLTKDEEGFDLP